MTQQLYHIIGILKPRLDRLDPKNWTHIARIEKDSPIPDGWEYVYKNVDIDTAHYIMNHEYGHATRPKIY